MQIELRKQPKKYLDKADEPTYNKLKTAIDGLMEKRGDVIKLKGSRFFRLKIEHYRIIFTYDSNDGIITVQEINTRTNIKYREWK